MADVHNRTRYLAGCRCETCKLAQSTYTRARRQAKKSGVAQPRENVAPSPTTPTPAAPGPSAPTDEESVVAGVREEIAGFVGAEDHPGLIATALALARILDTPSAIAQHAAAAGRLMDLMITLGKSGKKKPTKLGELRRLEGGKSA
ncbi:hypothetical protein L1080_004425 [Rhodococcus sp. MSC1_016]|jgi:hypothetical protein|uniref:hypothetical protein n=1 Tax=Rhodococcus sp. MSC1_016 TaxID=2909266 RepID=UPI00202E2D96|nr:hypothetical protein [Rhodococcus sp. MSC1_016]